MPSDREIEELEELYKHISDEEAEQLSRDMEYRLRRARINIGAKVPRDQMGALAYEVVAKVAVEILEGKIPIRTAAQARDVASVFHQIARLETGKSTSNIETLSREERVAKAAELAAEAAERSEQRLRLVNDA